MLPLAGYRASRRRKLRFTPERIIRSILEPPDIIVLGILRALAAGQRVTIRVSGRPGSR